MSGVIDLPAKLLHPSCMAKIKKLPLHEAQKIAAGEVVERPANVVKELVENALDASATQITVHVEDGGKQLIRVTDNGCGMPEDDAQLCFEQHATSKIERVDDLHSLTTFGFRGEALASIAAVSKVTLITKEQDAQQGTKVTLFDGKIVATEPTSHAGGTDITIHDLFYNIPARKKFLKTRETELRQITQLMHAFSLDYRTTHFKLLHDNKQLLNCPPSDTLAARGAQLWDHTTAKHLIALDPGFQSSLKLRPAGANAEFIPSSTEGPGKRDMTLSGLISNHQHFKFNRSSIFFFVNKRWVKNTQLSRALLKGYTNVLPPARYPTACIFIEIDPERVDINIHPRKEEIQFLKPRTVENLISATVKTALEEHLSAQIKKPVQFAPSSFPSSHKATPDRRYFGTSGVLNSTHLEHPIPFILTASINSGVNALIQGGPALSSVEGSKDMNETRSQSMQPSLQPMAPPPIQQQQNVTTQTTESATYKIVGCFKKTYILIEQEDGLFLVDQHAAHERVLYELFAKRFEDVATVQLMFPTIITLTPNDISLVEPYLDIFIQHGIAIELFDKDKLAVRATPVHLKNTNLQELVQEVISWITEQDTVNQKDFFKKITERLRAQMACKAAVKAGDELTEGQMRQLLDDLHKSENRLTCPHGRPTGWLLSVSEIEKKFKRRL